MPKNSIHPPGDKIQKALRQFAECLQDNPEMGRAKILEKVAQQYDLSPKECDFLQRHFKNES